MKKAMSRVLATVLLLAHLVGLVGVAAATEEGPHFEIAFLKDGHSVTEVTVGDHVTVNINIVNTAEPAMKYAALESAPAYSTTHFSISGEPQSAVGAGTVSDPEAGTLRMARYGTELSLTDGRATVLSFTLIALKSTSTPTELLLSKALLVTFNATAILRDGTATAALTIKDPTLTGISVKTPPTKIAYTEGSAFAPDGLVLTLTYNNSTTEDIAYTDSNKADFTFSPDAATALTPSHTTISITYGGKSTTQAIAVAPKALAGIAVKTPPTKIAYTEGNTFVPDGLALTLTYNNSTTEDIAYTDSNKADFTFTPDMRNPRCWTM